MARPKRRFSSAQAREAILDAGIELLHERGLGYGLGQVRMSDAIERSGVPQATAYRLYVDDEDRKPQDAFREAMLVRAVESSARSPAVNVYRDVLELAISDAKQRLDFDDPAVMAEVLREFIRLATIANVEPLSEDHLWYLVLRTITVSHASDGASDPIAAALAARRETVFRANQELFQRVVSAFGLALRDGYSWDFFTAAIPALSEGFALRWENERELFTGVMRPTGPDGELKEWSAFGLILEGFAASTLKADPEAEVSADLSTWLS